MHQTIDSVFNLDERTEVGKIPNSPMDARTNLVTFIATFAMDFSCTCFIPRLIRRAFGSTLNTSTSTESPGLTTLLGCLTRFDQLHFRKREPALRLHFQVPRKRRNRQRSPLRPLTLVPTGKTFLTLDQGSGSNCLYPRDTRSRSRFKLEDFSLGCYRRHGIVRLDSAKRPHRHISHVQQTIDATKVYERNHNP
jgi:hypothetical protein